MIRFTGLQNSVASFGGPLLFTWRERAVELTINEEVGQYATRAPGNAIGPSLDARGCFLVDKDIAAHNELVALSVMWSTEAVR